MTTNDQEQRRGGRRPNRGAAAFLSGVALATGAAMAVGAQVARHNGPGKTPIVTAAHFDGPVAPPTAAAPRSGAASQVAQAGPSGHPAAGGYDAASAFAPRDDDESLGTTADYHTFDSVYQLVEEHYVDQLPDDTKMSQGAVRAMIASLTDPNSYFLDPEQRALVDAETRGTFHGVGAVTAIRGFKQPEGYTEYKVVVVDAVPGSPAAKAGLRSGDVITHVDGKWVLGSDPFLRANKLYAKLRDRDPDAEDAFRKEYEAARQKALGGIGLQQAQLLLRKGVGEKRTLQIQRPGTQQPIKVELTTAQTDVDPVSVRTAPDGKATVIRVSLLTDRAPAEVRQALAAAPKARGVVLDLRGNPGGVTGSALSPALQVQQAFAQGHPLAIQVSHSGRKVSVVTPGARPAPPRQLVVLVDKGTARTAEALAASLQDAGAATVVGSRTFGDALSRTLYSLRDGSGFVLTTGKLLTPRGADWQAAGGIVPQVALDAALPEEQVIAKAESILRRPQRVADSAGAAAAAPAAPQP